MRSAHWNKRALIITSDNDINDRRRADVVPRLKIGIRRRRSEPIQLVNLTPRVLACEPSAHGDNISDQLARIKRALACEYRDLGGSGNG
jgi:hypothetical protein